jgi:hypothetical protein
VGSIRPPRSRPQTAANSPRVPCWRRTTGTRRRARYFPRRRRARQKFESRGAHRPRPARAPPSACEGRPTLADLETQHEVDALVPHGSAHPSPLTSMAPGRAGARPPAPSSSSSRPHRAASPARQVLARLMPSPTSSATPRQCSTAARSNSAGPGRPTGAPAHRVAEPIRSWVSLRRGPAIAPAGAGSRRRRSASGN